MKTVKGTCRNLSWIILMLGLIGSACAAFSSFSVTNNGYLSFLIFAIGFVSSYAFSIIFDALAEIIEKTDKLLAQKGPNIASNSITQNEDAVSAQAEDKPSSPSKTSDTQNRAILFLMVLLAGSIVLAIFQNVIF